MTKKDIAVDKVIELAREKVVYEVAGVARDKIFPELLALEPAAISLNLTKEVNNVVLHIVDKMMRPKRCQECELLAAIEDTFAMLDAELMNSGIEHVRIECKIIEDRDGPVVDIAITTEKITVVHFKMRSAMLIPALQKRYKEMRVNCRI